MIGKVIEIGKSTVVVELTLTDEQKRGIINYHVAFDMEGSTIIGEIASIEKTTAHISLLGEIKNAKFTPGISKKPYYMSVCRIIRNDELPIIVGNTNEKSVYIGRLSQYNGYQVYAKVNDLFSNHFAILGNTGSGKSHGMARLLQNVFSDTTYPKNANFFLFDAYGEYNDTFIFNDKNVSKVYTTKVEEFSDARTELLKIPLWLLDVDDIALLLNATKSTQLPIIEKALKLVGVFARNEEEIITYKNDIIAKALNELLYSGGTPSQIRDQIFAVLTSFNTKDLNLDTKVVVPGWTRPLRQCLIIDKDGKLQEMQLLGEFFNSFIKEDLKLELPDGTFPFTLEHLNQAFDFALISEGVLKSDKVYDDNHVLKVRLESLMNGSYKEYFNIDKYITKEQFIDSLVKSKDGEKKQIINFNISYVDDRFAKVLVKIISKLLFEYSLALDNRASFPIHILLEEAHRYVQNDNDINILGYNIFERITKEGRKYGVILGMISQRPSEISETAISQCANFLVFRMQHPKDLNYIREMVPNITEEMVPKFKVLQPGNCVAFGVAFKLPMQLKLDMPSPTPLSQNIDISKCWY
ncbi:MAG: ATP-binding protein [bacterium]|nr:ATP-binding protein [bacterium]MDY4108062.1 ATP-binding protein [Bacilli bacterium]